MQKLNREEDLVQELERYVQKIAYTQFHHNALSFLLGEEDIVNELSIELVQCWRRYASQVSSDAELVYIGKAMVRNRMAELIYRFHKTHRNAENSNEPLDTERHLLASCVIDQREYVEQRETFLVFMDSLTLEEYEIVRAILDPHDPRMTLWVQVYAMRRSAAYQSPTIKITPRLVADALHLEYKSTRRLFDSISVKWRKAYGTYP